MHSYRFEKKGLLGAVTFWEVQIEGTLVTEREGKRGRLQREDRKTYEDRNAALEALAGMVNARRADGFIPTDGEPEFPSAERSGAAVDDGTFARNDELEAALFQDPSSLEAHLVYADWLQSEGDPRGELIALQHLRRQDPDNAALRTQEAELLEVHGPLLLGKAANHPKAVEVQWELGFINRLRLSVDWEEAEKGTNTAEIFEDLLAKPTTMLLRELTVGMYSHEGDNNYQPFIDHLVAHETPPLRSLFLGDFEFPEETEMSWSEIGDASKLWAVIPDVEKVILQSGAMTLGDIVLPKVKHFEVRSGGLDLGSVRSINQGTWPELETLIVWFGSDAYGAEGGVKDIAPILAGEGLGKVKHLGLMNAEFTDDIVRALADSAILPQLRTLDLSLGTLSATGAQIIVDRMATFQHLERLNLHDNYIPDEFEARLSALGDALHFGEQDEDEVYDDDDEEEIYRYASVGE